MPQKPLGCREAGRGVIRVCHAPRRRRQWRQSRPPGRRRARCQGLKQEGASGGGQRAELVPLLGGTVTPATAQLPPSYRPSTPATAQLPPSYRPSTPATAQLPTLGCFSGSSTSSTFPWISVILSSNPLSLIICLPKLHILRITACTQAGGPTRQAAGGRRPRGAWQAGRSDGQGLPPAPRALLLCPTWPCG